MYSYKLMVRVLEEQCNLTTDNENPVEIKTPKEIPSNSLQNPSDPDASYSGHKGQGYQVQVMETFCEDENEKKTTVNLITHVEVEPAHNSDAKALIPALESVTEKGMKPKKILADSLYGSDDNHENAKEKNVDLVAPTMGSDTEDKISLSDFEFSPTNQVLSCPMGNTPEKINKKKRNSVGFSSEYCEKCPSLSSCPVQKGKKRYYLRFTEKQLRIALRRAYEKSNEFTDEYRWRAGVEATMSELDRRTGVKHLRVRGMKAVRFSATLKCLAINIFRAARVRTANMMPKHYAMAG